MLQIQPQGLGNYCGSVGNMINLEKLKACTYYFSATQREDIVITQVWQLLSLTIHFGTGKHKSLGISRVKVSAAMVISRIVHLLLCFCAHDMVKIK